MFRIPREWTDQTAVIFGGGPSLTQADVDYAISRGWRRIACNNAYLLDPAADVLCWADQRWFLWNRNDLGKHTGKYKICWRQIAPIRGVNIQVMRHHHAPPAISSDSSFIVANNTGQGAINIAFLFGAKRIILLGFDMKTAGNQHNWHNKHKGPTSVKRYMGVFAPAIAKAAVTLRQKGIEVLNCTPGSALTCFPMAKLREVDPPKVIERPPEVPVQAETVNEKATNGDSMEDFWISMMINAGIGAILMTIKNPNSPNAIRLKASLLHLADAIYTAFGSTPAKHE